MISVVIPTFNRPDGLKRAVESIFKQSLVANGFDLIIVDNTPDASADSTIALLRRACPDSVNLITRHEPAAGVANARNCAMSAVNTDLVAFLDDDQSAPKHWLETLLAAHQAYPATVTFGPVRTILPTGHRRHQQYFSDFFARQPNFKSGYIEATFGCGNSLIDFSKVPGSSPWFDAKMNEIGGEDDILFARIQTGFGRFAWAQDAHVWEHPPSDRVTLSYTLKRAFSYGQAPITLARRASNRPHASIMFWMLVGAAKTVWHGLQWAALSLLRHPRRAFQLDAATRGVGKLLWWVDVRFYGAAVLSPDAKHRRRATPQAAADDPQPDASQSDSAVAL
ncbi:MAG: glycosyltransferase family 2 protein [Pseudomonadota bacterium]